MAFEPPLRRRMTAAIDPLDRFARRLSITASGNHSPLISLARRNVRRSKGQLGPQVSQSPSRLTDIAVLT